MKVITSTLKNVGANETTINLFIVLYLVFIFLIGIGAAGILFYEIAVGQAPTPILVGIVTTILGITSALGIASHNTLAINGTAAKAASQTAASLEPSLAQSVQAGVVNAQALQAIVQTVLTMQQTQQTFTNSQTNATAQANAINVQANTDAVKENTAVTQDNTLTAMHHDSELKHG